MFLREIKDLEMRNVDLIGKTVREVVELLENLGTRDVKKGKMYVDTRDNWNAIVKNITYHKGYGFGQINAVLHI